MVSLTVLRTKEEMDRIMKDAEKYNGKIMDFALHGSQDTIPLAYDSDEEAARVISKNNLESYAYYLRNTVNETIDWLDGP